MLKFFRKNPQKEQDPTALAEETSFYRIDTLPSKLRRVITAIAVAWSLYQIYTAAFGLLPAHLQRGVTLGFAMLLAYLGYGLRNKDKGRVPIYDWIFSALTVTAVIYIFHNFDVLVHRAGAPTTMDVVLGIVLVVLAMEACRRTVGLPLVIVTAVFLAYAYFGPQFPGLLGHRGYTIPRIFSHLYLTLEGLFGIPMYVMTTYVFAFILFGAFLDSTGGARLFINLAYALAGASRGGPAKTAVIASALMGTISGSSLANVVTTGNFTIPLMKRVGYKPSFAGAAEAAASSGGQFMPPVMGAAAFIMAEMTGIAYLEIVKAAFLPAVLYFFSIFVMVHLEANRLGLRPTPPEDLPELKDAFKKCAPLILPVGIIIALLVMGYSPLRAALFSTGAMIITSSMQKETRLSFQKFVATLEKAALNSVAVTAACAMCGIISGIISLTGLGLKMAQLILQVSGGVLLYTLVLTMFASIVLGMGLPTTAKYIVLATIAAPALVAIDVPLMVAHLFIFYYGIVAEVTPPVALTSYAGAAVAKAPGVETALTGLRLSFAGFLIPYLFVYSPTLLLMDVTFLDFTLMAVSSVIGVICLGVAMGGFWFTGCYWYERLLLFGAAILLISHGLLQDGIGAGIFLVVMLIQKGRVKQRQQEMETISGV